MPTSCCAYNCTERFVRGGPVSFYRFPTKNEMLFRAWCIAIRRKNFRPSWASRVCSKHFTADSFEPGYSYRKLKRDAVPTIFNFGKICRKKWGKKLDNSLKKKRYSRLKEKTKAVEIVNVKREFTTGDEDTDFHQVQYISSEYSNCEPDSKFSNTFEEKDSVSSQQLKNLQDENESLRQVFFRLSENEVINLSDLIPLNDLFKDISTDEANSNSEKQLADKKLESVAIIKISRQDLSEGNENIHNSELLEGNTNETTEDHKSMNKTSISESVPHNQLENLRNENLVLKKTIQDLMIQRINSSTQIDPND